MTSSWLFLSTLNYDARSTTHQTSVRSPHQNVPFPRNTNIQDFDVCETVHHYNNDVSNQQDATIVVYWSFLLIYLNLLYMFRATNSPIIRSTFDCIYGFGTTHRYCCRSEAISVRCTKAVYSQKCSWRWTSLSPETCTADSNKSTKMINKRQMFNLVGLLHRCSGLCSEQHIRKIKTNLRPVKHNIRFFLQKHELHVSAN